MFLEKVTKISEKYMRRSSAVNEALISYFSEHLTYHTTQHITPHDASLFVNKLNLKLQQGFFTAQNCLVFA